jgi:signal transduction histidine kinase
MSGRPPDKLGQRPVAVVGRVRVVPRTDQCQRADRGGLGGRVPRDRGRRLPQDALQELRRRAPVPVSLTVEVPGRLDPAVETAAYFVVAESLQNASRHASDARVEVALRRAGSDLLISVRDDGPGGADQRNGSGLRGLADRVAAIGGRLTVASAPPRGRWPPRRRGSR